MRCRASSARLHVSQQSALRLGHVLATTSLRERGTYRGGNCLDLRDVLAPGGAVGRVHIPNQESVGGLSAGIAVYRLYRSGVIRTVSRFDATLSRGAARRAVA